MCIALPVEIVRIDEKTNTAEAVVSGSRLTVNISLVSPKVGDYVLVHAGYAVDIVKQDAAAELTALLDELDSLELTENDT